MTQRRRRTTTTGDGWGLLFVVCVGALVALAIIKATDGFIVPLLLGGLLWWFIGRPIRRRYLTAKYRAWWEAAEAKQAATLEAYWLALSSDLDRVRELDPYEFEHVVATLLREAGWTDVGVTQGSGDRGIDVLAVDPEGRRTVVQCKLYSVKVGGPAVRNLEGARAQAGAERALLVTTAEFTREAYAAAERTGVELMDGEGLIAFARTLGGYDMVELPPPLPFRPYGEWPPPPRGWPSPF